MHFLRVKQRYKSFQMVLTCPIMHFLRVKKVQKHLEGTNMSYNALFKG